MSSKFEEKYPNHRIERRNEKIIQMAPATGWWKVTVLDDGERLTEPVAFFANVAYESRGVWDGGHSQWEKEEQLFANTGTYG